MFLPPPSLQDLLLDPTLRYWIQILRSLLNVSPTPFSAGSAYWTLHSATGSKYFGLMLNVLPPPSLQDLLLDPTLRYWIQILRSLLNVSPTPFSAGSSTGPYTPLLDPNTSVSVECFLPPPSLQNLLLDPALVSCLIYQSLSLDLGIVIKYQFYA